MKNVVVVIRIEEEDPQDGVECSRLGGGPVGVAVVFFFSSLLIERVPPKSLMGFFFPLFFSA